MTGLSDCAVLNCCS